LVSCIEDDVLFETSNPPADDFQASSGSADFSTYVALGNSLTAGFADNALFIDGQMAAYPNLLAEAFSEAGGGGFSTPFMNDNLGGATLGGDVILGNRLILSFTTGDPTPVPVSGTPTTEISNKLSGSFNNMGVPGATSYHLLAPGYGSLQALAQGASNPYFVRFSSSESASILEDAVAQSPTFFTLWIGNNDLLGYAASGGSGVDQLGNLDPSTYAGNDISDPDVLGGSILTVIQTLKTQGAQGVIGNIPDLLGLPFFNTVPFNPVPLDQATADLVNGAYAAYNAGLEQAFQFGFIDEDELNRRIIAFTAGSSNAPVIVDEDLTDLTGLNPALINMRQTTAEDLIVLSASSFIGTLANPQDPTSVNGVGVPLGDQWVLTPEEQAIVDEKLALFNQVIASVAEQTDTPLADMKALFDEVQATGIQLQDGSVLKADFATGGAFSLDGIHPSPRGYAVVANEFMEVIEQNYNASLRRVNPLAYKGLFIQ